MRLPSAVAKGTLDTRPTFAEERLLTPYGLLALPAASTLRLVAATVLDPWLTLPETAKLLKDPEMWLLETCHARLKTP